MVPHASARKKVSCSLPAEVIEGLKSAVAIDLALDVARRHDDRRGSARRADDERYH
jgi:hypothetical protein